MAQRYTLKDVLRGAIKDSVPKNIRDFEYIYLVREGKTVFYIGKTQDHIVTRLRQHCGLEWNGDDSELGKLVNDSLPDSLRWTVEFISFRDCMRRFSQTIAILENMLNEQNIDLAVNFTEKYLIRAYAPCLNRAHNPFPTPLPRQYQELVERRQQRKQDHIRALLCEGH